MLNLEVDADTNASSKTNSDPELPLKALFVIGPSFL